MIGELTLDYTTYAPPLTADDVRRDIDAHTLAHLDPPVKIIMWIHQWDYLTKEHDHLKPEPEYIFDKVAFNEQGDLTVYGRKLPRPVVNGQLWGIHVEVREL